MIVLPDRILQRMLAVTLLLALLVALAAGIAWPLWSANAAQAEQIAEQRRMLGHYRRIAAEGARLERELARLERWYAASKLHLRETTEALAAAELQRIVKQQVTTHGGRLVSAQTLTTKAEGAFSQIAVKVHLTTDLNGMLKTLHGLENARPLLFIDNLSVRGSRIRRRLGNSTVPAVANLEISFEVSGFMRVTKS